MTEIPVYDRQGSVVETLTFDESCLGSTIHWKLLHDAVVMYEANQRQGTHSTKSRCEVMGSTKKPWRQKGTGRARSGMKRSPLWRGGGIIHGPKPRDYRISMPKKARRLALLSALLGKLRDGEIKVLANLDQTAPKTKDVAATLNRLGVHASGCLVVTREHNENVFKSTRNIGDCDILPLKDLNAYAVLKRKFLVMTKDALTAIPEEVK